ncbi:hypothetical protein BDZ89DRAFT_904002, partial [Hymenopellis radicata]
CRLCGADVKETDRQIHMGQHIVRAMCGAPEPVKIMNPVAIRYPCGFCGAAMTDTTCCISIKSGKANSNCPYAYSFQIAAASQFRDSRPGTNVPIACNL